MFVIDANKEELAIKEANTLGIPVVAILDVELLAGPASLPVPAEGRRDRAIRLYCEAIATAATKGNRGAQGCCPCRPRRLDVPALKRRRRRRSAPQDR